ncbi:MAG: GAF domain-containing protein [Cyclobacteriaceae bacterium]
MRVSFILAVLVAFPAGAQNISKIDSLRTLLASTQGEKKLVLLNELAWECRSAFPDSTIRYAQLALDLSDHLGQSNSKTLNYLGLAHYYKGNLVRAYEYYEQAGRQARSSGDSTELAYSQNNIGRLFSEQGMLTQSYPYFVRAESLFQFVRDSSGLAYVYQSFANLYKQEKDFVRSEQRYRQALEIRKQLGNPRDVVSALVLLGKMYVDIRQFDDAMRYFRKADSVSQQINDALAHAEVKILMAEYHLEKGFTTLAKALCWDGLNYILNFKNVKLLPRAYLVLGEIAFAEEQFPAAKKYFTIALNLSRQMKYMESSMRAHYHLWKTAERMGNREEELIHSNEYLVLKDSVNDINLTDRIAKFQFQLEIERKQQENELLKANQAKSDSIIRHQYLQATALGIILLLTLGMLYFQWRNARRKKAANRTLAEQKQKIESMNAQLKDVVNETTERNKTLQHHVTTLLEFSKSKVVNFGTTEQAAKDIARLTAHTLKVSRVSIWTFNKQDRVLESVVCYDLETEQFLDKLTLDLSKYPHYEQALNTTRIIDAPDARMHRHTFEFTESYLKPLGIYSMLDITFSLDGELNGLICCEQKHDVRTWKTEDIIFASSVADITSLAYRSAQRRDYERRLRQQSKEIARMNELLEQRVKERTAELENRNEQLTEYAFINSHLLRSPVSKILGLINLLDVDQHGDPKEMMRHLRVACDDLDAIVKKITIALDAGEHFDRKVIKPQPKANQAQKPDNG